MSLDQKVEKLHKLLHDYARVAVAFSGGVDSSLLLKSALDVLGAGNVLVLFAESCLVQSEEQQQATTWLSRHGLADVDFLCVPLQPLTWKEFAGNSERRCYHCKLRMYKEFLDVMHRQDVQILLDGTNSDDLKTNRPGLQAIHELGVKTPLVAAGFDKNDIRTFSKTLNLDTWNKRSSSCLATRIPYEVHITSERLQAVVEYEKGMENLGFFGCRVRLHPLRSDAVFLQVQQDDIERLMGSGLRLAIIRFFQKAGVQEIFLDLIGRQ